MSQLKITIEDLFNLPDSVIHNPDNFKPAGSITIDSRNVKKNSLFVAIKGENFDGHDFTHDAITSGASCVVIDREKLEEFSTLQIPFVTVKDTTKAYGTLARSWRRKLNATVISLTGSNGKTTVKEILADLFERKYKVVKSKANNNNHIGVPLTIFSADDKTDYIILEHGTNHFGEIEYTAKIAEPDYAIITNIGDAHIEFLNNKEGVYKEKSALFDAAEARKRPVFINSDDPIIKKNAKDYTNKITFGFNGNPDIKGKLDGFTNDGRPKLSVKYKNRKTDLTMSLYGTANAKNVLAACAVALTCELPKTEIQRAVKKVKPFTGRLDVKTFKNGIIIDDTYNSNPDSMKTAIEVLKKIKKYNNKVLILGDMFELGDASQKLHKEIAKLIPNQKSYTVLTTGKYMKYLHQELKKKKKNVITEHFLLRHDLVRNMEDYDVTKSVILIKGSRGMKMEEFVDMVEKGIK